MNTVIITLRSCPVGALGFYGNEWIATPNLDRLASEGIVFDRHISDCPTPEAAHQAWRSGKHQTPRMNAPHEKLGGGGDLVESLKAAGVRTVLVQHTRTANDPAPDFYAGWDERFVVRPADGPASPMESLFHQLPDVLEKLRAFDSWCLWIEIDRLVPPWDIPQDVFDAYIEDLFEDDEPIGISEPRPSGSSLTPVIENDVEADEATEDEDEEVEPEPIPVKRDPVPAWHNPTTGWFDVDDLPSWELLHRSFAAALTTFDADLGRLFALFRDRGVDQSATWFLTADRGYPLGEHGLIGYHRPWLHEELVHVPLIVRLPNAEEGGRRVTIFTQPADLMPTLLAAHGIASEAKDGVNLLPHLRGETRAVRPFACSGFVQEAASEWAIRTPEWAYLLPVRAHTDDDEPREPLLFEKPDDRWEVNDLRIRNLGHADDLEKLLREFLT